MHSLDLANPLSFLKQLLAKGLKKYLWVTRIVSAHFVSFLIIVPGKILRKNKRTLFYIIQWTSHSLPVRRQVICTLKSSNAKWKYCRGINQGQLSGFSQTPPPWEDEKLIRFAQRNSKATQRDQKWTISELQLPDVPRMTIN